ncbi:MAG TPA: PilZ domain-containing protein [Holophaga sp.]|nr:PilZ domain-containing protein [Holophaga sp.]HPS68393.1 PilZ domain-containing protein [Holophaga sp.]
MSSERRQYRRIPMGATVAFQEITFTRDADPALSDYLDVSGGGLLLNSPREIPLGTLLKLELRVPGWGRHQNHFGPVQDLDARPLVAVGQVVRVEALEGGQFELGIKFLNVYPDDLAALLRYIEAIPTSPEP